jgi:tetratricopeptide (TPR) repeat protein
VGGHGKQNPAHGEEGHLHTEGDSEQGEEHNFLGRPKDPLDAFSRHFFVSQHTHLTEKGTNAPKEILPWLELSARLDPKLIESYTVGAYWLRELHKDSEAEQFLREGLRQNPQSYEIMFELGRGYFDKRDYDRARNVLEMALQRWREQENPKPPEQQDRFVAEQIVNYLARVEDRAGNRERSITWLELLKKISPNPGQIDRRIAEMRSGKPLERE